MLHHYILPLNCLPSYSQVYEPGLFTLGDLVKLLPIRDPTVIIQVTGEIFVNLPALLYFVLTVVHWLLSVSRYFFVLEKKIPTIYLC